MIMLVQMMMQVMGDGGVHDIYKSTINKKKTASSN
jgi:hypothetical protein